MFSVTGPVTTIPSACRGDATNWMPNRPISKTTVPRTFRSASRHCTAGADLPEFQRAAEEPAHLPVQRLHELERSPLRRPDLRASAPASRWSWLKWIAPSRAGLARSRCRRGTAPYRGKTSVVIHDRVGRADLDAARQPSGHFEASRTGKPRKRSGSAGALLGYAIVRCLAAVVPE